MKVVSARTVLRHIYYVYLDLCTLYSFGLANLFTNVCQILKPFDRRTYAATLIAGGSKISLIAPTRRQLKVAFREAATYSAYYQSVSSYCIQKRSSIALDVGANIGYYAKLLCMANEDLMVFSFEPDRRNAFFYSSNLLSVPNAVLINAGISDRLEYKHLSIPGYATSRSGELAFNTGLLSAIDSPSSSNGSIFLNGSSICNTYNIDPAATGWIKIDVEGFEESVLKSFDSFVALSPAVIQIELNNNFVQSSTQIQFYVDFVKRHDMAIMVTRNYDANLFNDRTFGVPSHSVEIYLVKRNDVHIFTDFFLNAIEIQVPF